MRDRPRESLQELPQEQPKQPAQEPTQAPAQESVQEPSQVPIRQRTRESTRELAQEQTRQPRQQPAQEPVRQPIQELLQGQTQRGPKSLFEMAGLLRSRSQDQGLTDLQEQLSNNKQQLIKVTEKLQQMLRGFLETERIRPSPLPLVIAVLTFYIIDQLGNIPLQLCRIIDRLWSQILDWRTNSRRSAVRDHEADHEAVEMHVAGSSI